MKHPRFLSAASIIACILPGKLWQSHCRRRDCEISSPSPKRQRDFGGATAEIGRNESSVVVFPFKFHQ